MTAMSRRSREDPRAAARSRRSCAALRTTCGAICRAETPDPVQEEDPALTQPLVVARPPEHWLLVGALLEDLRRIHEALTEQNDVSG